MALEEPGATAGFYLSKPLEDFLREKYPEGVHLAKTTVCELLTFFADVLARFFKPVGRVIIHSAIGIPTFIASLIGHLTGINRDLRDELGRIGIHEIMQAFKEIIHPLGFEALKLNWGEFTESLKLRDFWSTFRSISYIPEFLEKFGVKKPSLSLPTPTPKTEVRERVVEKIIEKPVEKTVVRSWGTRG